MSEQATQEEFGWTGIRISLPVKRRLTELQVEWRRELGRQVSYSEVIEHLLADQWGDKP